MAPRLQPLSEEEFAKLLGSGKLALEAEELDDAEDDDKEETKDSKIMETLVALLAASSKPQPVTTMKLPPLEVKFPEAKKRKFVFDFVRDNNGFLKQIIATEE